MPVTERAHRAEARFWGKVAKTSACWIWTAGKTNGGYGHFFFATGQQFLTHRFSWELHFGPIPAGAWVLHHCDTPPCVRPDHLFLGSAADNTHDMIGKRRHAHGERHGSARLDAAAAEEIRRLRGLGLPPQVIADRFTVSEAEVRQIAHGKRWAHVGGQRSLPNTRPGAKLSPDQVETVRRLYAAGGVTQEALGLRFGVSQTAVGLIVRGVTWPAHQVRALLSGGPA